MELYERFVELRKRENLSQEKLAEILNISRQAVSKWESGD
ncbi:helix-turn-helix transcriptional regulator [Candidatus Merdisoma sp. JLR.KK006]